MRFRGICAFLLIRAGATHIWHMQEAWTNGKKWEEHENYRKIAAIKNAWTLQEQSKRY